MATVIYQKENQRKVDGSLVNTSEKAHYHHMNIHLTPRIPWSICKPTLLQYILFTSWNKIITKNINGCTDELISRSLR